MIRKNTEKKEAAPQRAGKPTGNESASGPGGNGARPAVVVRREITCGFCQNTVVFEHVRKGQKIACPKCNATLEIV